MVILYFANAVIKGEYMKKLTTLLLMLLLSCCFVLAGCGETPLTMPTGYETVYSNGGFVVGAGNYMYFANAYKDSSSLKSSSDNEGKNAEDVSIKRVEKQTNSSWFNIVKDEENKISYEKVINKIAGYQVSNMFIANQYLYFTSPNIHKNKENSYEFELSTLFRIKLDGTGLKEVYTSKTAGIKMYLTADKTLLMFDDEKIMKLNAEIGEDSFDILAEDVSGVEFPSNMEQELAWVYYTSNRDEDSLLTGNILNKVSIATGDIIEVSAVSGQTIKIISQNYGRLFYTKSGKNDGLYSNDFSGSNSEILHRTLTEGIVDASDLMYIECENSNYNSFVFMYNDNLYIQLITDTNDAQAVKVTSQKTTIQFSYGSYVYYSTDGGIYRYSVMDRIQKQIADNSNVNQGIMDFDGRYIYYFASDDNQESSTEYLYRADAYVDGNFKVERVGELSEADAKAIEEAESDQEQE